MLPEDAEEIVITTSIVMHQSEFHDGVTESLLQGAFAATKDNPYSSLSLTVHGLSGDEDEDDDDDEPEEKKDPNIDIGYSTPKNADGWFGAPTPEPPLSIDCAFLKAKYEHSLATYGNQTTKGVLDHILKEIEEVRENPTSLPEWCDIILLALDGAMRVGWYPQEILNGVHAKQAQNRERQWPQGMDPDVAVEHNRAAEAATRPEVLPMVTVVDVPEGVEVRVTLNEDKETLSVHLFENGRWLKDWETDSIVDIDHDWYLGES